MSKGSNLLLFSKFSAGNEYINNKTGESYKLWKFTDGNFLIKGEHLDYSNINYLKLDDIDENFIPTDINKEDNISFIYNCEIDTFVRALILHHRNESKIKKERDKKAEEILNQFSEEDKNIIISYILRRFG